MTTTSGVDVRRGHLVAVLLANAVLWAAAVWVTSNFLLGGPAVIAIASIASLLRPRP
jgi:hypothetical protein